MGNDKLTGASQLVIKNHPYFIVDNILILGPPGDHLYEHIQKIGYVGKICASTMDYFSYQVIKKQYGVNVTGNKLLFGIYQGLSDICDNLEGCSVFDGILLYLQKSDALTNFFLDMVASHLSDTGKLWLVGENKAGIRSWFQKLNRHFYLVSKLDSARRCQLYEAIRLRTQKKQFRIEDYVKLIVLTGNFSGVKICTLPGVFCYGRLDKGTEVLINSLEQRKYGHILDFGCGSGIIAACIARYDPIVNLTLVDCDALALESSKRTLTENGINKFRLIASDGLDKVKGKYDFIVSNPPFHRGVKTDYLVVERFIRKAKEFLNPQGEFRIVANSFLRYKILILDVFGNCDSVLTEAGYTVYRARVGI